MIIKAKRDSSITVDMKQVESNFRNNQKIALIKDYRNMSGLGLKESKEAIESAQHSLEAIRRLFYDVSSFPYDATITKKQMMRILEKALDSAEPMYFDDKPEAFLAKKYEDFIDGI
jgi:hypothetical protein